MVLGGLLQQRNTNFRMKKNENWRATMPKKAAYHPEIIVHHHPTFENRSASVENLSNLALRFAFVSNSGSGKGVCMLQDLLLRH